VLAALPFGVATSTRQPAGWAVVRTPGAAENLATDDLIYMLNGLGVETGVSLPALSEASAFVANRLDHRLPSRYAQALAARANQA
jgi:hydroxymethylglutaryl-CoA lyase